MKSTKKSLALSVLSLVLCVAMLLGTTFAWFTDSVTSGVNKIVAGNLDIELEALVGGEWIPVTNATKLFDDEALWEPGHTEAAYLKLSNVGTLALKYNLAINVANEVEGTNVAGDAFKLSDYLYMGIVDGKDTAFESRDDARAAVSTAGPIVNYAKAGEMLPTDDLAFAVVVYMPETVGNEANYKTGTTAPSIELGINVAATQLAHEADSFGIDYDKAAPLTWSGAEVTADEFAELVDTDAKSIEIWEPEELAYFAEHTGDYSGYTVTLMNDIDLGGAKWTPMNLWHNDQGYALTIDGNGKQIKNMSIVSDSNKLGFISTTSSGTFEIKDLTFKNPAITTEGPGIAGVVIGQMYGNVTLDNVDVVGANIVGSIAKKSIRLGGLIGQVCTTEGHVTLAATDCDVDGASIRGFHNVGGFIGTVNGSSTKLGNITATNCSVKNCTLCYGSSAGIGANEIANEVYVNVVIPGVATANNKIMSMPCDGLAKDDAGNYYVSNAVGMMAVREKLADGTIGPNDTVKLDADIDMTGKSWSTVKFHTDLANKGFKELDGQGHTISNMDINGQAMFYVATNHLVTVKNVTFDNAKSINKTAGRVINHAIIASYVYSDLALENVTVKNSEIKGNYKVAPLVATVYDDGKTTPITLTVKDCKVEDCTVTSTEYAFDACGMVAWVSTSTNQKVVFEGSNTVKNVQIICPSDSYNKYAKIWHDGNTAHDTDPNVTVTNVTVVNP